MVEGWDIKELRKLGDVLVSNVDKKTINGEHPVSLCNYMDVYSNEYIDKSMSFMEATATNDEIRKFTLHRNDVIFTKDSETPDDIAVPAVVTEDIDALVCGYHLAIVKPYKNLIDGYYLMKSLQLKSVSNYFSKLASGSTRFGLSLNAILTAKIPFPKNIKEQSKIAEILTKIDEAIEQTEKMIAKQERIKTGLMQDLFTKGIDENGNIRDEKTHKFKNSKLGRIPIEWDVLTLDNISSKITDGSHFSPKPHDSDYIIANIKDMRYNKFDFDTCTRISYKDFENLKKNNCSPNNGDVLLSKDGTIGRVIVYKSHKEIVLLSSIAIIRLKSFDPDYLGHVLRSHYFKYQLYELQSGSALRRIVLADIKKLKFPFPNSIKEQNKIADLVFNIDNEIHQGENQFTKLQRIKSGLMQDLLTGKIRVTHLLKDKAAA